MLRSLDALEKGFRDVSEKSKKECIDELEKIHQLILIIKDFDKSFKECETSDGKTLLPRYAHSLVFTCYVELVRISGHILFLSCNGLYINAFNNIRYALESIVQALYIDVRHPKSDLKTKIEILKEVEDKYEYRFGRLIRELKHIDNKKELIEEYRKLSQIIHPTHEQVIATITDLYENKGVPTTIDCEEISKLYDSMTNMYDIFFFLLITYFPEVKDSLRKNTNFAKDIKNYNLTLLSKVFNVKL